jgi:ubiquinone/menaquinone biosynthesis C-methylase UbiE
MQELKLSAEDQSINGPMEQMVSTYDGYMQKVTLGRERVLRDMTVTLAQIKPGDCVLEAGCGTDSLSLAAKRRAGPAGQVFGLDVSPGMIEVSRQKAAQAGASITFQLGSINAIPFPENQFDVVMCSFMIPVLRGVGFSEVEFGSAPFRILGLSILGCVRGRAGKN